MQTVRMSLFPAFSAAVRSPVALNMPSASFRTFRYISRNSLATPPLAHIALSSFHTSTTWWNEHIINIQDEKDFTNRVTKNTTPVIVDFHASWCGPCKLLGPRLESLIASKNGKVILAKIDIDELSELAVSHGVEAVPTVIAMKNGKVIDKFIGLKDDVQLETFIQKIIT